jgi:hypothetical protein
MRRTVLLNRSFAASIFAPCFSLKAMGESVSTGLRHWKSFTHQYTNRSSTVSQCPRSAACTKVSSPSLSSGKILVAIDTRPTQLQTRTYQLFVMAPYDKSCSMISVNPYSAATPSGVRRRVLPTSKRWSMLQPFW